MAKTNEIKKDNSLVFYTRTRKRPFDKQKAGSSTYQKYGAVLDKDTGNIKIKVIQTYNIVDTIQTYRKDVDIYELIRKYQNGDLNALNRISCVYSDISSMPLDLYSMSDSLRKIDGAFNSLDDKVKKKLNLNSTRDFMESIINGSLYDFVNKEQAEKLKQQFKPTTQPQPTTQLQEDIKESTDNVK